MLENPFFSFFCLTPYPSLLKPQLAEIPPPTLSLLDHSVLPCLEPPKKPLAANLASKKPK